MSSSAVFTGAGFYVAGASQATPGTVRVVYSSTPKASSSAGANDALNPANYTLSGPGPYSILSIQPVSGSPVSFDILLGAPLLVGTWTVAVSNVQTPASNPLTAPTSAQFQVTSAATLTPLSAGAENDDAESIIRKHLSPAMKGDNWNALIAALSTGDDTNWDNAEAAFDQLYMSTASGLYLDRRASDQGVKRPINVGISDDLFRQLAIKTTSKKLVHEAIREILEVYYGRDSLRAYSECTVDESYNLTGDVTLTWTLDEKDEFTHTFQSEQFGTVTAALANEVAFALTKTMRDQGSNGFAIAYQSPETGLNRVRIYSGSLGLGSFVRVTGGSAQNILKFPTEIDVYDGEITGGDNYDWVYSQPEQDITRLTLTEPTSGIMVDLSGVREGDYLIIGEDADIDETGTFEVLAVGIEYSGGNTIQTVDIERIDFTGTATQLSNDAYRFYRPTKSSIMAANGRTVVVAQTVPGKVDISIPATTQAVTREPKTGAYGRISDSVDVARIQRLPSGLVEVQTIAGHGYTGADVGKWITLDGVKPVSTRPFVTNGNGAAYPSAYSYQASHITISAPTQAPAVTSTEDGTATVLANGDILFTGGFSTIGGIGYIGPQQVVNRYRSGASTTVIDGTEADGATQHSHTWVATPNLTFSREHHAASTNGSGAIVTGGISSATPLVLMTDAEAFDGSSWTTIDSLNTARAGHQQQETDSGVIVFGGAINSGDATNSMEVYDGTSWTAITGMNVRRTDFASVKLSSGSVVAIGGRTMGRGHDLDDNTLALWRLNENASPAADETGNYPLAWGGAAAAGSDWKIDGSIDTTGGDLTGAGSPTAATALTGEWTIEMWFKITGAGGPMLVYAGTTGAAADHTLIDITIDGGGDKKVIWKWQNGGGFVTDTVDLAPLAAYVDDFFSHLALVKSLNGLTYTGKVNGWAIGDLIQGRTSGAMAFVTSVDGGAPGGANGTVRLRTANHLNFLSGEDLVIIPANNKTIGISLLTTAATAGASLYDLTIYINGFEAGVWTGLENSEDGSGATWSLGSSPKDPGNYEGLLDDVKVSTRARSAGEIRQDFLRGWGNCRSLSEDMAIGELTNTVEMWDGGNWTRLSPMNLARCFHRAQVLPGDYILVTGGLGYNPLQLTPYDEDEVLTWPSKSLNRAEIYNPHTGRWSFIQSAGVRRHGHLMSYLEDRNEIVLMGGLSTQGDNADLIEILDLNTKTWKTAPSPLFLTRPWAFGGVSGDEVVIMGGSNFSGTSPPEALLPAGNAISSGGLNGQFAIADVPDGNTLHLDSNITEYTSTMGSAHQEYTTSLSYLNVDTASRTSNITTLVLVLMTPSVTLSSHGISVGDYVYVNSLSGAFGSGLKLVTAVTSDSISYAETAANQASISIFGSVSQAASTPALTAISAPEAVVNDPGPILIDPYEGVAVTSTEAETQSFTLYANQQYEEVEINSDEFPTEGPFWICLGFGTDKQTPPIKVLSTYQSGSNTRLVLDYTYRFTSDFPVGSTVTLLASREAYQPEDPMDLGAAWLTAASAGRVAAQAAAEEALAAGIDPDVVIVYPGDRGLGGEGLPAIGAQKLSDKVSVFAGDEIDEELQARREE